MVVATTSKLNTSWAKAVKFLKEVRTELRKVAWPNKQELITYTIVVLVTVGIVAVFLGVVDVVISEFLKLLGRIAG